jgi:two-component system, LytTR family, response regulator
MKLTVLIVDDERIARHRLRRLLENEQDIEIIAECADGDTAVRAVREHRPDLVLLDVKMPGMDGFDVLDSLDPKTQPAVVFITAFDRHAVHAFETCALDYLLKPVAAARLSKTLTRVRDHLASPRSLPTSALEPAAAHRFAVRSGQTTTFLNANDVDWIEADGNYAILHVNDRNHLLRQTMAALERQLPAEAFIRVSRSAILRIDRVKELRIEPGGQHVAILKNDQQVAIRRSIREVENRIQAIR